MNDERILRARPPILSPGVFQAVAQGAEANPDALMVVMRDPEACATVTGIAQDGAVVSWQVLTPTTDEGTREFLADEMKRQGLTEREIVFLSMDEVTVN